MTTALEVHGVTDPAFARVRDAFAQNFADHGEVGASLCVTVGGRTVVDIWAGHADAARTKPWERDTIVCVWSTTKGMTAACAHRLADRGLLDLDAPVAKYWPEFARAGKEKIPVRYLLSHQAGLPAIGEPLPPGSLFEWDTMVHALETQAPWWEPGTAHGYHAFTYGWLVGEVVRRISGKSLGTYFRDEIAGPLSADFHIGTGPELDARCAEGIGADPPPPGVKTFLTDAAADPTSFRFKTLANPPDLVQPGVANTIGWRRAEIPGANGHSNARGIARVYSALANGGELDGVQILSPEAIERGATVQAEGPDLVLGLNLNMALGWVVTSPAARLGPNPRAFGHSGAGGSLGFADPDARLAFGYAMNRQIIVDDLNDPRWPSLIDSAYACL